MLRVRRAARLGVLAGSVVLASTMLVPPASANPSWKVVASGLDSPRHLAFASGDLYVVEAGRGGDVQCGVVCGWLDAESFPSAGADVDRL